MYSIEVEKFNEMKLPIYRRFSDGLEQWWEHDEYGNLIHFKDSNGVEQWWEYENGELIHSKNSNGSEKWFEYDEYGNLTHFKDSNGVEKWFENGVEIAINESEKEENQW